MTKIRDDYFRWMAEKLTRYDKIIFLGAVTWLKWGEMLQLPRFDPKSPAWWTSPVFLLVGLACNQYLRLNRWWQDLSIAWVLRMMAAD
jgi:hypothetical protein